MNTYKKIFIYITIYIITFFMLLLSFPFVVIGEYIIFCCKILKVTKETIKTKLNNLEDQKNEK